MPDLKRVMSSWSRLETDFCANQQTELHPLSTLVVCMLSMVCCTTAYRFAEGCLTGKPSKWIRFMAGKPQVQTVLGNAGGHPPHRPPEPQQHRAHPG